MVTFDDVLPRLLRVCSESPVAGSIDTWCVVRDLRGRVRVVVRPSSGSRLDGEARAQLQNALSLELGRYFAPPMLATDDAREQGGLARNLLEKSVDWPDAVYEDVAGDRQRAPGTWRRLESRLSKLDWLSVEAPGPSWELRGDMPPVVTFYSFKGGVGRTTALCSYAWQLAAEGKRIAIVDFDLEAPGLGSLVGAATTRGVIDFVVDFVATDEADLEGMHSSAGALGADGERVQVFPAGELNRHYLDKLARLDFTTATVASRDGSLSPTANALRSLTQRIAKQTPRPEAILIDSRAGLHDLAGLSLHGLAHVDVLLTRASEQGYRGLALTLSVLASRRKENLYCVLVHAMAQREGTPGAEEEAQDFRARTYDLFREHVYTEMSGYDAENIPALESAADRHTPYALYFNTDLHQFIDLASRRRDLFAEDYIELRRRIDELTEPEDDE